MSIRDRRRRFDFFSRLIDDPDGDGYLVEVIPDPSRYEWRERGGERLLFDRLDKCFLPPEFLHQVAEYAASHPPHMEPPDILDAAEYTRSRVALIRDRLDGKAPSPDLSDKSAAFLDRLRDRDTGFVIASVDLVASTSLWRTIDRDTCIRVLQTTQHEFAEAVARFHGHVLKYTGDGLIAYFAEPTITAKSDLAIDCALTLHRLMYTTINPLLRDRGLPALAIRTGMDVDEARVTVTGSAATKLQVDILGEVVNLATKIQQQVAAPGDICVRAALERNLHTHWRKLCHPSELPTDWPHTDFDGSPYRVFAFTPAWTKPHVPEVDSSS